MVEQWGLQLLHALGRMFLNPLLYWVILLLLIAGARRIKRERMYFGTKIFQTFNEIKQTFSFTILFGLLFSIISITFGFVFTIEMIIIVSVVTILLSVTGSFHLLSPVYTLGMTFFILMLLPLLPESLSESFMTFEILTKYQFVTIVLLLGLLLIVEGLLIIRAKENHIYPALKMGERGIWLGEQQLKRLALIPFVLLIPTNGTTNIGPLLPYFDIGDTTYYMAFIPFIIGTQLTSRSELLLTGKQSIGKQKLWLATIVLLIAIASYFYFYLSFVAVIVAIIGNEWITYRNRIRNEHETPYFAPLNEGIKVLATIPGSRAEELEILPGEIITKVNGLVVRNSDEFYQALQHSGAFFKLDVLDTNEEVRFIQSAFYAEDHHELGIVFPEAPFRKQHKNRYEQLSKL